MADTEAKKAPGKCTKEFLQIIERIKNLKTTGGAYPYFDQALNDCVKTDDLEDLCKNNPTALRRKTFDDRIAIAQKLKVEPAVKKMQELLNTCGCKYEVKTSGSYSVWVSSISANVCGYLDDLWKGSFSAKSYMEGNLVHDYSSDIKYQMPSYGGIFAFSQKAEGHQIAGRRIVPVIGLDLMTIQLPSWGDFNGLSQVDFTLWGVPHVVGVINLTERNCNEGSGNAANNNSNDNNNPAPGNNSGLPPLAPLPGPSEIPPLAPLPGPGDIPPLAPLPGIPASK
jgi:hypothetical protein